jgi:hypothetical protein
MLVQGLIRAGETEAALSLLEDQSYDVDGAEFVIRGAPEFTVRAMRAARERWRRDRAVPPIAGIFPRTGRYFSMLSQNWRRLDPLEAREWLDEALAAIEEDPDHPTKAEFGNRVELHSERDMHVFQLLNLIRALGTPDEVQAIFSAYPAVATAAMSYPLGMESVLAERSSLPLESRRGGFIGSGSHARRGGGGPIEKWIEEAHHLFRTDINRPNTAPRVFWPSCHAYGVAMYYAGKANGVSAEPYLLHIPDTDIMLCASIQLAAGALGLDQYCGVRIG